MRYKELLENNDYDREQVIDYTVQTIVTFMENRFANNVFSLERRDIRYRVMDMVFSRFSIPHNDADKIFDAAMLKATDTGLIKGTQRRFDMGYSLPLTNEFVKNELGPKLDMVNRIKHDCSQIIQAYKASNACLYRGTNQQGTIFVRTPRVNRKPLDTPNSIHLLIDSELQQRGFKALRSNSLFCTSDSSEASSYGHVYAIFPKNGFDFTCWENSTDLFKSINDTLTDNGYEDFAIKADRKNVSRRSLNYLKKHIAELVDKANPINDDIIKAINTGHEIMIANAEYYGINYSLFENFLKGIILGD